MCNNARRWESFQLSNVFFRTTFVKLKLLPSSFDAQGRASLDQRLTSYLIDGRVAIDAGSLGIAADDDARAAVRDIIITHPHIDHIASLPIFVDDLFPRLEQPVRVHATEEVIALLERDVFNWTVYPRFSELQNNFGHVMQYVPFRLREEFAVAHLRITAVAVNHIVPTVGLLISDDKVTVAFGSDTGATDEFWALVNEATRVDAVLLESSFPDELQELADISHHLTPAALSRELAKMRRRAPDVLAVHIKPAYRNKVVQQLAALKISGLRVMEPGREYEW